MTESCFAFGMFHFDAGPGRGKRRPLESRLQIKRPWSCAMPALEAVRALSDELRPELTTTLR